MTLIKIPDEGAFSQIVNFLACWEEECRETQRIFKAIPEKLLHQEIFPEYRSLARLAWHILESPREMLSHVGVIVEGPEADSSPPNNVETIVLIFGDVWQSVKTEIARLWQDESLAVIDKIYGQKWSRSKTLTALLHHMIHHRAQMTVLMRVCDVKVPGIYGPSKEEWASYGLEPPKV